MSFSVFVVTYRVANFLQKLIGMWSKLNIPVSGSKLLLFGLLLL